MLIKSKKIRKLKTLEIRPEKLRRPKRRLRKSKKNPKRLQIKPRRMLRSIRSRPKKR